MISSYTDCAQLLEIVRQSYPVDVDRMTLHRDMIGHVYFLQGGVNRYVLKLYRSFYTEDALNTIDILKYLKESGYPAVSVVPTNSGEMNFFVDAPGERRVGILYNYIEGAEPDIKTETEDIALQVARLHQVMENYPYRRVSRTKAEYIDDYISIMKEMEYIPGRIDELQQYGDELWNRMQQLPRGFCHGDLHTGNMLRTEGGEYLLFDFDDASWDYPIMDVAYLSDDTNFNRFDRRAYDRALRLFDRFYAGYGRVRTLSNAEISAVPDFIAVRHYQIIARIVRCQGPQCIKRDAFFDEQYGWLLKWRALCERKGGFLRCQ